MAALLKDLSGSLFLFPDNYDAVPGFIFLCLVRDSSAPP